MARNRLTVGEFRELKGEGAPTTETEVERQIAIVQALADTLVQQFVRRRNALEPGNNEDGGGDLLPRVQ
jgi:hypothetical protein